MTCLPPHLHIREGKVLFSEDLLVPGVCKENRIRAVGICCVVLSWLLFRKDVKYSGRVKDGQVTANHDS